MRLENIKATTAALWVFAVSTAGLLADITSSPNWLVLAGCAIAPPLMMMRYGTHADQTMTQSIQQVLR